MDYKDNIDSEELYTIEQIRQKVRDWGFTAKDISSNMVQLGNKMSSIKRTKDQGIILYVTEEFFESICAAENTIDGIVQPNVIGKSKEDAKAEIEKLAGSDVVICTRQGNKVINPSTAENYLPHEIRIYSSKCFDLVMEAALNKNPVSAGISVNDSIWVAAALLAYEALQDNSAATKQDMYFRQVDICKKAAELTDGEVRSARANQWCNADADKHSNNYLRGDHVEDTTLRRLTAPSEFTEKAIPTAIQDSKEFTLKDGSTIAFAKLAHFARTVYTEIVKQTCIDCMFILNYIQEYGGKAYVGPEKRTDANRAEMEAIQEVGSKAAAEINRMALLLEQKYGLKPYGSNKWLDGSNTKVREYLWRQTKYVGYEDSPESISIFADVREGKARFRFTLENDGILNKAGDLERHNRLIELPQDTEHHLTYIVGGNNEGTFESLEEDRDEVKRKYEAGIYKKIQINRLLSIDEVTSNEQAITEMRTAVEALLKYYEYVIGFKRKEVYPSLEEYDPGITSEEYERILSDESLVKYDWLDTIYYLYKMGGEATCKQIANDFGNGAPHYNSNAINVAKAVAKETQCPLMKRDNGGTRYWPVLFFGYDMDDTKEGQYCYIMRPPLKEAIERMESNGYFERMTTMSKNTEFDHNLILYGPPGTGKTYSTAIYAVAICDDVPVESLTDYDAVMERYNQLKAERRVAFTTFHQSYGYEEFIEGIKPVVDGENKDISYTIEPGIFKKFCEAARRPANMDVDPNASIWFMRLDDDNAKTRKDECFAKGELIVQIKDDDAWSKERFVDSMQIGDYVLSYAGSSVYIDAIGLIEGEAIFDENRQTYQWSRKVKWYQLPEKTNVKEINSNTYLPNFSIAKMSHMKLSDLLRLIPQETETDSQPYVFVIDEINRGNISKIFGELITLIENTKREGMEEAASAILPYSGEAFSVPSNVYILGTMNTADRSIALMDTALRRRFQFIEMMPDSSVLEGITVEGLDVPKMLDIINERIKFLYDREHAIGHAFFTGLRKDASIEKLASIFEKSVIPLLQEYFYEDYQKIQLVLGDNGKSDAESELKFIRDTKVVAKDIFVGSVEDVIDLPEKKYEINPEAFLNIDSYKKIGPGL